MGIWDAQYILVKFTSLWVEYALFDTQILKVGPRVFAVCFLENQNQKNEERKPPKFPAFRYGRTFVVRSDICASTSWQESEARIAPV